VAVDFQVIYPQDLIPLTAAVERQSDSGERLVVVTGKDFRTVEEVVLNEMKASQVIILSKTQLQVTVPEELGSDPIQSISVFSNQITLSGRSVVRFKVGDVSGKTSGMLRLMQFFLKLLFTSPGRDIFDPQLGGDALKNIGHSFGKREGATIIGDYVIAVDRVARQIIALQARDPRIPREERLLNAKVESATFDAQQSALVTSTALYNQAGKIGIANVVL
jgi:hypothetical protein